MRVKQRLGNIEALRCLLTLGIVLIHVIGKYGVQYHWLSASLMWCVNAFVFITGYFGVRFSPRKIFGFIFDTLFVLSVSSCVAGVWYGQWQGPVKIWCALGWNWFVMAYLVLLCFVPIINCAVEQIVKSAERLHHVILLFGPILVAIFGYGWLAQYNFTAPFVARVPGFTAYSPVTLMGMYIVGRLYATLELSSFLTWRKAVVAFVVLWIISMAKVAPYNSPIAAALAICAFRIFEEIRVSEVVSRYICLLSPSMFPVFVVHANPWFLPKLSGWVDCILAHVGNVYISFLIVGFIVFVGGIVLDIPRRIVRGMLP